MNIIEVKSSVDENNQAVMRITLDLPIVIDDDHVISGTQVAAMQFGREFIEKLIAKLEELDEERERYNQDKITEKISTTLIESAGQ